MKWWLVLLPVFMSGCANEWIRIGKEPAPVSQETVASPIVLTRWQIDGRIGIQHDAEGYNGRLQWFNDADRFRIRLVAPLGRGTYEFSGNAEHVVLEAADGAKYSAPDSESLMERHLGWSVPVDGVSYWMRGLVAPGTTPKSVRRDEVGNLLDMEQDGWRISVLRRSQFGNYALPTKLFLHRDDLKIRIVISNWEIAS